MKKPKIAKFQPLYVKNLDNTFSKVWVNRMNICGLSDSFIFLNTINASPEKLMDEGIQVHDAKKIYAWMCSNFSHGTFTELRKLMVEHKMIATDPRGKSCT